MIKLKRIIIAVIICITILSSYVFAFTDVPNNTYYTKPVEWAVNNNITSGTSPNTFQPFKPCSRAEIVTFLWRYSGSPEPKENKQIFQDINKTAYYAKTVTWAYENKITSGINKNTFSPNQPCSRAQAVTFLWRLKNQPLINNDIPFVDIKPNTYYYNAIKWAVQENITNGTDTNHFSPDTICSRSQIITFLYRTIVPEAKTDTTSVAPVIETIETPKPVPTPKPNIPNVNYGNIGRLYIKNHSVALYNSLSQATCDAWDSACYGTWSNVIIIADHKNQGFDIIKTCKPGDTCYILHQDGAKEQFICTKIEPNGRNMETDVLDRYGNSAYEAGYNMFMYTCNENWKNITITYWNRI